MNKCVNESIAILFPANLCLLASDLVFVAKYFVVYSGVIFLGTYLLNQSTGVSVSGKNPVMCQFYQMVRFDCLLRLRVL